MRDLATIEMIAGINTEDSSLAAQGQYVAGNNVRFWKGRPQKIGGSIRYVEEKLNGAARGKVAWRSLNGTRLAAFGTAFGLFLLYNETLYDITPIDLDGFLINPFRYTIGSKDVNVYYPSHGLRVGERIIFDSLMQAGGVPDGDIMAGSFFIKAVVDDDNFTIEIENPVRFINGLGYGTGEFTPTAYGGENQLAYFKIPIVPGLPVGVPGGGYGSGAYGAGGYGGDVGLFAVSDPARVWTLDHWGENLVASFYGSQIFQWEFQDGPETPAYILPGAPNQVGTIYVSEDDRILVARGATGLDGVFDPNLIRWSDQENNQSWIPTEINYAGDKRVEKGSRLMGGVATVSGHLIMTDTAAYAMTFIGQPFVYSLKFIDENCGMAATHGIGKIDDVAFWIGLTGFYRYDGIIRRVPCSLQEQLFGDSDTPGEIAVSQMAIIAAGENKRFRELQFHYPVNEDGGVAKVAALQMDGDQAVWWIGDQARSCWIDQDLFLAYPVAVMEDGTITVQEYGLNALGAPLPYSLTTSDIDISDGSFTMQIERIVHDFKRIAGNHSLEFIVKENPRAAPQVIGPFVFNTDTQESFIRAKGRSIAYRMFSNENGTEFRLGKTRIAAFQRGRRGAG